MNIEDTKKPSDFLRVEPQTDGKAFAPVSDCWFVVIHKQGLGGVLRDGTVMHLLSEGFEFYKPMFIRNKRCRQNGVRSTVIRPATEPLFPGYVFVKRSRAGNTPLTSIQGIEGGFLGAVSPEFVDRMRAEEVDGFIRFVRDHDPSRKNLRPGDTVETLDGFMRGIVDAILPDQRLQLLSRFLNGSSRVVVDVASIYRVERAKEPEGGMKKEKGGNRFMAAADMAQRAVNQSAGAAVSRPSSRSRRSA